MDVILLLFPCFVSMLVGRCMNICMIVKTFALYIFTVDRIYGDACGVDAKTSVADAVARGRPDSAARQHTLRSLSHVRCPPGASLAKHVHKVVQVERKACRRRR